MRSFGGPTGIERMGYWVYPNFSAALRFSKFRECLKYLYYMNMGREWVALLQYYFHYIHACKHPIIDG
jgi:hypothetical protein